MRRVFLIFFVIGLLAFGAGQTQDLFAPLTEVYRLIHNYFYRAQELEDAELLHGAIRGMIDALGDPYSTFFDPQEYARWQESLSGEYSGIGMEITIRDGRITVVTVFPGTPAAIAGIRPGDWIQAVDGQSTEGMKLEDVSARIRGPEGTSVTLTVQHVDGVAEKISLVRTKIRIESVQGRYIPEEQVGYVRILRFDLDTPAKLGQILYGFPLDELVGMVLDLRNNPGGYLGTAVEVASFFVDQGTIVKSIGTSWARTYSSRGNSFPNLPLAVLVNEGTASAAEIVAGAIQDHGVGVLVGRPTFGKGLIQEIVWELPDGSAIRLTTGEYFTPSGRPVQDVGLTPDIVVEALPAEGNDPDLAAALDWIRRRARSLG